MCRNTIPVQRSSLVLMVAVMKEDLSAWPGAYHLSTLSLSPCQAACCIKHFPEQLINPWWALHGVNPGVPWGCLVTALRLSSIPPTSHPRSPRRGRKHGQRASGSGPASREPQEPPHRHLVFVLESQARKEASGEKRGVGRRGRDRMGFHCVTISQARWWRLGEPAAWAGTATQGRTIAAQRE